MKKVLSVLLAAAMVMGMSVASFAAKTAPSVWESWSNNSDDVCHLPAAYAAADRLSFWPEMIVVNNEGVKVATVTAGEDYDNMHVGDVLYFAVMEGEGKQFMLPADSHWSINIKGNEYVEKASFENNDLFNKGGLTVKVEIVDELDDLDAQDVKFQMYIAENHKNKKSQSEGAKLNYSFDNYKEEYVDFDFTNDVDYMAKWIVAEGDKGTAIFDFEDVAYFTVKMIPEEEVIFNFESLSYVKAIEKIFDYEGDYTTYNFKGTKDEFAKVGELFIEADDESFIYGWDGEALVEIEAEYVKDYDIDGVNVGDGWVIETKELGYYVVSAIEAEIEVEAEVEAPVEADKANPETGAADFVGAAVAMAVVSVAAAGALALKK